jgi:hypothetical protein
MMMRNCDDPSIKSEKKKTEEKNVLFRGNPAVKKKE